MPKCQTGIKQPFFSAPSASAAEQNNTIIMIEVWPLNQGIVHPKSFFKLCITIQVMAQNVHVIYLKV
jgi:hypothetical protein